jgi:hypothetical protein
MNRRRDQLEPRQLCRRFFMDFVDGDLPNLPEESGGVLGRTIHWALNPRLASRQHRNLSDISSFNHVCSIMREQSRSRSSQRKPFNQYSLFSSLFNELRPCFTLLLLRTLTEQLGKLRTTFSRRRKNTPNPGLGRSSLPFSKREDVRNLPFTGRSLSKRIQNNY